MLNLNLTFAAEVIKWCSDLRKVINHLSDVDIFFGIQERKDYLFGNFLLVGKQYTYNFRCTGLKSFLRGNKYSRVVIHE